MNKRNIVVISGIAIIAYLLLFMLSSYHYNDPDSYYYLSMTEHKVASDRTLLGDVSWNYGLDAAKFMLMLISIVTFGMFYDLSRKYFSDKKSLILSIFFLFSPFIIFLNSWFGRLDKNIFELFLFVFFLYNNLIVLKERHSAQMNSNHIVDDIYEKVGLTKPKKSGNVNVSILLYGAMSLLFYVLAAWFWQGWKIFIVFNILYLIYFYIESKARNNILMMLFLKKFYLIAIFLILSGLSIISFMTYKNFSPGDIAEMHLMLFHIMIPEIALFIILLLFYVNHIADRNLDLFAMILITISGCIFFPRLLLFCVPLSILCYGYIYEVMDMNSRKIFIIGGITIYISMSVLFYNYFQTSQYENILSAPDPCHDENCTIISDWSFGHIYQYAWNHSVMFSGSPGKNIPLMLDLLYYRNQTCAGCVKVYHPYDRTRFEAYAKELNAPVLDNFNETFMVIPD